MWVQSLFLALLIVFFLQAKFLPRTTFKAMKYRRYFTPDIISEGETTTLVEEISNSRLMPVPWIRIEAQLSPYLIFGKSGQANFDPNTVIPDKYRQFHRSMFTLPPYTTITRRHTVFVPHRGYYAIPSVSITTGDVLGIGERKSMDYSTNTALTVYPQLTDIGDIFSLRSSFTGDIVVRRWIVDDPFFIRGVREYQPTDPQNRVNWKATAKTGRLQVHNYDYTSDVRLMLFVNVDTAANQWSITTDEPCAERGISYAASIAQYALDNGIETGLCSNGKYIDDPETPLRLDPCTGGEQLQSILLALAKLNLWRRVTFQTLLKEEYDRGLTGCDILIISAYTSEDIEIEITKLREAGNNVEILTIAPTPKEDQNVAD